MSLTQKRGDVDVKVAGAILVALLLSTACAWRLTPVSVTCMQEGTCRQILEANQEQANKTRSRQILEANQDQANKTRNGTRNMGPNTREPAVVRPRRRPVALGAGLDQAVAFPAGPQVGTPSTPTRSAPLLGPVNLILFDLDGTLTRTPGQDRLRDFQKAAEIAPKLWWLVPALDTLVGREDIDINFGIMSRSSTASETLNQVATKHGIDLRENGKFPDNLIHQITTASGELTKGDLIAHGFQGFAPEAIMLIDDDWRNEFPACQRHHIKFYPVDLDSTGRQGLTKDMFMEVIEGFGVPALKREVERNIGERKEGIRKAIEAAEQQRQAIEAAEQRQRRERGV